LEKLIPEVLFRNPSSIKMRLDRGLNTPGSPLSGTEKAGAYLQVQGIFIESFLYC
jgi:hypothetical protein